MAKTEVILIQNVVGLGGESDQVKVAAGYARNYLFPQGLAIPQTGANKRRLDALRKRRGAREAHELNTMTELAQGLSKLMLVIQVRTGEDGRLFGSVTAGTIADELKHQFEAAVDKRKIHLREPIKRLGEYEVDLRLHPEVTTTLKVRVDSSTPAAKPVEIAPADKKAGDKKEPASAKPSAEAKADSRKEQDRFPRRPRPEKPEKRS
jgi:large subunit ribosomal protein L9